MLRPIVTALVLIGLAALLVVALLRREAAPPVIPTAQPARVASATPTGPADRPPAAAAAAPASLPADQALWAERLARSEAALAAYRATTRYPHSSRPAGEQRDQMHPNRPISQRQPVRVPGGAAAEGLELVSTQERVFVQGDERVRFTLAAVGGDGQPRPLTVIQAVAHALPAVPGAAPVPVAFTPDASGVQALNLHPASQGFAGVAATIRVDVALQVAGQSGYTHFDVVYSPEAPASWTGAVRDRVVNGSLRFELPVQVVTAGRYVAMGRVDDAHGRPFALLSFNEVLAGGRQVVALTVFGKLLRDGRPALPLRLRDVEAFLLHENRFPDRSLLPRRTGLVHQSGGYPLAAFSDAEWTSEERERYLAELGRDVVEAQSRLGHPTGGPRR